MSETGWRNDPWIQAMAKLLLSKGSVTIKASTARDAELWVDGSERIQLVQEGLRRWAREGQIQWRPGPRSRDPMQGAMLTLLDAGAVMDSFGLRPREASYQSRAIEAIIQLGVHEDRAKALCSSLLGSKAPPQVAARGAFALCSGRFPSLRAASAQCFAGDSKFLDSREALLAAARGPEAPLLPAPIAINAWVPQGGFDRVLFIENFDTFCLFSDPLHAPERAAIVYCKGFAGSARRIRSPAGRRLFIDGDLSGKLKLEAFFNGEAPLLCEHFGDLDWAGLDIFLALSKTFEGLSMWAPGCDALLREQRSGGGHEPSHANKSGQIARNPNLFSDPKAREMAEALAVNEKFIDQEFYIPPTWLALNLTSDGDGA